MLERGMPLLFPYSSPRFFHSGSFVTATTLRPAWDAWTLPSFLTHGRGEHTEPCTAGLGVLWSVSCYRGSQWLLPVRQASGIFLSESEVRKSWEDNTWGKVAGCEQLWTPVRHQPLYCALSPHGFAWFVFVHAWNSLLRISLFLSQTHTHTPPLSPAPSLHSASLFASKAFDFAASPFYSLFYISNQTLLWDLPTTGVTRWFFCHHLHRVFSDGLFGNTVCVC